MYVAESPGFAPSPTMAIRLTNRVIDAMTDYISQQQDANGVPKSKRAILVALNRPQKASVFVGHKKTKPMFVFMTILLATFGLCFLLENIRPRVAAAPEPVEEAPRGGLRRNASGPEVAAAEQPADRRASA